MTILWIILVCNVLLHVHHHDDGIVELYSEYGIAFCSCSACLTSLSLSLSYWGFSSVGEEDRLIHLSIIHISIVNLQ